MTDISEIVNFTIQVLNRVKVVIDDEVIPSVKFKIHFHNGDSSGEIICPLLGPKGLEKLDWYGLHPYITIHRKLSTVRQHLTNYIRSELANVPEITQYHVSSMGAQIIEREVVFNFGGGLIRPSPDTANRPEILVTEPQTDKLDIDPNLSEMEAISEMAKVVMLSPDAGRVMFAHTLLYDMRLAFGEAWKPPRFCLFLVDGSGQAKTTYSAFLTQLHNRSEGMKNPVRVDASPAASVDILYSVADCVLVLDDLCPLEDINDMKKQERTLLQVTRFIGDGTVPARKSGKETPLRPPPKCGVLFTGEYEAGKGSTAARLLIIRLTSPIDSIKFLECQTKPLAVSTFHYFFCRWYVDNYNGIVGLLKKWWVQYVNANFDVHGRLRETHFYLNAAYKLFLRYCVEKDFMPTEKAKLHELSFENLLTGLIKAQNERVNAGNDTPVDLFELTCTLVKGNTFKLAKGQKQYRASPKKYDGLKHKGLICLPSDRLLREIQEHVPNATRNDLSRSLRANKALKLDSEGKNHKIGNDRFYGIIPSKLV